MPKKRDNSKLGTTESSPPAKQTQDQQAALDVLNAEILKERPSLPEYNKKLETILETIRRKQSTSPANKTSTSLDPPASSNNFLNSSSANLTEMDKEFIFSTLAALTAKIKQQEEEINSLRAALKLKENNGEEKEIVENMEEIERRRSIVIAGLPEEQGTPTKIRQLNLDTAYQIGAEATVSTAYHVGPKKDGKPRLLKVVLVSHSHQKNILRKAKNLRENKQFENVYIRPSLTPEQQKNEYDLRQELRALKSIGKNARITWGWPGDNGRKTELIEEF